MVSGLQPQENAETQNQVARGLTYLRMLAQERGLPHEVKGLEGIAGERVAGKEAGQEFVKSLFGDKVKAEKAILKQMLNEISLRESLHKDIVARIDDDILKCENFLLEISSMTDGKYFVPEESIRFGTRRTGLEMKVFDLESAKREEDLQAWQDLSTLRRYLLFALKDYWAAARRSELLGWNGE